MQKSHTGAKSIPEVLSASPPGESYFQGTFHLNSAQLVAELDTLGVCFLRGARVVPTTGRIAPDKLLLYLASSDEARLRLALIPLLLRRPDFSAYVNMAVRRVNSEAKVVLMCYYTAAFYLQKKYHFRLEKLIGSYTTLPDLFSEDLNLRVVPNPEIGLQMLARRHAILSGKPINWLGTYEHAAQRWLTHMERKQLWKM